MRVFRSIIATVLLIGMAPAQAANFAETCDFSAIPGVVYDYRMTAADGSSTPLRIPFAFVSSVSGGLERFELSLRALRDTLLPLDPRMSSSPMAFEAAKDGRLLNYRISIYASSDLRIQLDALARAYGFIKRGETLEERPDANGFSTTLNQKPSIPNSHPLATDLYWKVAEDGTMTHLLHCSRAELVASAYCEHYTITGKLIVEFDYPLSEFHTWRDQEKSVLSLINCFRESANGQTP